MIDPIDLKVLYIATITITYLEMGSELFSPCLAILVQQNKFMSCLL